MVGRWVLRALHAMPGFPVLRENLARTWGREGTERGTAWRVNPRAARVCEKCGATACACGTGKTIALFLTPRDAHHFSIETKGGRQQPVQSRIVDFATRVFGTETQKRGPTRDIDELRTFCRLLLVAPDSHSMEKLWEKAAGRTASGTASAIPP